MGNRDVSIHTHGES